MHDRARYDWRGPERCRLVRDHPDHLVDEAVEARTGTESNDPKDPGGRRPTRHPREADVKIPC